MFFTTDLHATKLILLFVVPPDLIKN